MYHRYACSVCAVAVALGVAYVHRPFHVVAFHKQPYVALFGQSGLAVGKCVGKISGKPGIFEEIFQSLL